MISQSDVKLLVKKYKINEFVVLREYAQLLLLQVLYSFPFSEEVFFKGGTAIRLLFGGERFSEDLDFTVQIKSPKFDEEISKVFDYLIKNFEFRVKQRESIAGKTYLLTSSVPYQKADIFVKLDFSMREQVIEPTKRIITTEYPLIMKNFIYSMSKDEILAEKVRAIMKRRKHRDLYDLWVLQENGAVLRKELIEKKLKYYDEGFSEAELRKQLEKFDKEEFIMDMRPFVPTNEREKLGELFDYVKAYALMSLSSNA